MAAPLVAAAAKWAAKKTGKKALAKGAESDAGNGLMKVGGLLVAGAVFMALLLIFVLVGAVITLLGAVGGASAGAAQLASCNTTVSDPSGTAVADIPQVAMDAYQKAATASGVDWVYIAAIGKIESDHGRTGNRHLDAQGNVQPTPIYGPPTAYGRAEGPMQFLSSTWASVGRDGNFDAKKDAQNIYDAALTTGFYLKASGAPGDIRGAIFAYNHATWYVDKVMAQAQAYQAAPTTQTTVTAPATPASAAGPVSTGLGIGGRPNVVIPPTQAQIANAVTAAQAAPGWTMPMKPGTYTLTAHWGQPGSMWSKGYHTGQDFAAPVGTPMFAIGPGKVILRPDQASWAGPNFLMVDHGMVGGHHVISWYAHMSSLAAGIHTGTVVQAGTALGFVGALGNVTGPHLHLEVHVDGPDVDPMIFLTGAGVPSGSIASDNCGPQGSSGIANGNGAWGGYENGKIPLSAMCQLSFDPAYLECNAAKSMELLNAAYTQKFGRSVGPVGGYRSYADQVKCQEQKGDLCATPGTSNHGWGLAADLDGGGINKFGTPQHNWMVKKAGGWGWVLPAWAQANGSKPEPWHWEYMGTGNTGSVATPVGGINPAITAPPSTSGSASFIFGDWNMLGAAHTDAGGNKSWQPDSSVRTPNEVRAIRQRDISVMTMQEFEPKQQDQFKNVVGSSWTMWGNADNMVAWRTAEWRMVAHDTFQIPYFDGNQRSMPIVRLQSKANGTEIIVISVHNPADVQWSTHNAENRAAAVKIEGNLTKYLATSGVPVYFAGDMNDRQNFFCTFMAYGAFQAAAGGSYLGSCNPPGYHGIDWIMGDNSRVSFADHNVDDLGIQYSDHPIVYTHTTARN